MQMDNSSQQPLFQNNHESYQEVFGILDEAGLAQLKPNFCEHCIQDKTLNYIENEEELKQLLREIGIPLGMSIPFVKLWNRRASKQDVPDVTKVVTNSKVSTVDQGVQAVVQLMDACSQTEECHELFEQYQNDPSYFQGLTAIAHYAEHPGNHASSFTNHLGFMHPESLVNHLPITAQQPQVVASNSYLVNSENPKINFSPVSFPRFDNQYQMNHNPAMFSVPASGSNPPTETALRPSNADHQKKSVPATGMAAAAAAVVGGVKGEIVDECEDLAIQNEIEQFQRKLEKQPPSSSSYATAVKENEPHRGAASPLSPKTQLPRQQTSGIRPQQALTPPPSTQYSKITSGQVPKQPTKLNPSSDFAKCDDITVEHGVLKKSNSLQSIGSQHLHDYLNMIEESREYREVILRGNVPKGWKPLDGTHVTSGRKVQFKPTHCDDKGRMCHGVRVRGADKSEECFKHTTGKAPLACSFAHSRLGDTLQFICAKCTCEKKRNEFCADKFKHKQFHFNLGRYRNQNGDIWKLAVST